MACMVIYVVLTLALLHDCHGRHTAAQDSYPIAMDSYQMIAPSIKRLGSYLNSYQLIDGAIITYPNTEQLSADT